MKLSVCQAVARTISFLPDGLLSFAEQHSHLPNSIRKSKEDFLRSCVQTAFRDKIGRTLFSGKEVG